jgi:hypothetical protein
MRNSSQLIPSGVINAARVPAYGLPVVREVPLALEPVGPETFGGLTGTQSPTPPRRGLT